MKTKSFSNGRAVCSRLQGKDLDVLQDTRFYSRYGSLCHLRQPRSIDSYRIIKIF